MMRGMAAVAGFAALLGSSAHAEEDVASIASVIKAFKAEIREAQDRDTTDCALTIKKVAFRFDAGRRFDHDANLGVEVEALGVKLGASGETTGSHLLCGFGRSLGRIASSLCHLPSLPDIDYESCEGRYLDSDQ